MALSIHERAVGETHPLVASILEDLAAARREDGDDHEADRLLARATSIKEEWRPTVFLNAQAEAFERDPAASPPIGEPPAPDRGIGTRPPHGPSSRSTHRTRTRGPK
jgi:hypothetical protein